MSTGAWVMLALGAAIGCGLLAYCVSVAASTGRARLGHAPNRGKAVLLFRARRLGGVVAGKTCDVYCPEHGTWTPLFAAGIEEIGNMESGVEAHCLCPCDTRGVRLTGRRKTSRGSPERATTETGLLYPYA